MKTGLLALIAIPVGIASFALLANGALLFGLAGLGLAYALIRDWDNGA